MDQIKKVLETIKQFWRKQSKKGRRILLSVIGGILVVSLVIVYFMNRPQYVTLYSGLSSSETSEIVSILQKDGYKYNESNDTITVDSKDESTIRVELANQGYPKSTLNYDFYTSNVSMMTTSEERTYIEKIQLTKTLSSVIETISGIKSASVIIDIPETNDYVLSSDSSKDNSNSSKASVTLTMSGAKALSNTQVNGIKTLVARSVPNLTTETVAVIDAATGEELGSTNNSALDSASLKSAVEKNYENYISKNIHTVLDPVFKADNVRIAVKSKIDIDKKIQEAITYTPSQDNKGVVSSESSSSSQSGNGTTTAGGTVGTSTNTQTGSDTNTYPSGVTDNGGTFTINNQETYDYLVSKITEQVEKNSGDLKDLTISVLINQDGIDDASKSEWLPIIANAADVSTEKIAIVAKKFSSTNVTKTVDNNNSTDKTSPLQGMILYIAIGGGALLLILLILFIILKSRKKKKKKKLGLADMPIDAKSQLAMQNENDAIATIQRKEMQELQQIRDSQSQQMKKEIQEFSGKNPEIAAQLVRSWLRGEDGDD